MKIRTLDRLIMALTPLALLTAGFLAARLVDGPAVTGQHYRITEDSPLWRPELDATPVRPTGQELIIPLSGDPVADCWMAMSAMEYADTLAVPLCQAVQRQQG